MTVATARLEPSSKLTVAPSAAVVRPWIWMPRRRAARGVEPIRLSRSFIRRPMRESTVLPISPVATRKVKMSRPKEALGQRRLAGADGEVDLVGAGELLGDLEAGVAAADHEHGTGRDRVGRAVGRAVELHDVAAEPISDRGTRGTWKGPVATTTWSAR